MMIKLLVLAILCSKFAIADEVKSECKGDLTMIVTGLNNDEGQIKFDLDNSADTFKPREGGPPSFMKGRSVIKNKRVEYSFKGIPCGNYAVKFYHDENMNQDLDKNFLKIPTEQYGFSNCKGCMLPPSFEKAKFLFDKEHTSILIEI